jgi:DNA-binding response OmpR family regulator/DNA-binding CsgD family transcriptional regulator
MQTPLVLIVDDQPENILVIDLYLSQNGYQVIVESSGAEAIRRAETELPDLILLDINMPDMNGFEVCRTLKNNSTTAFIPIIFVTSLNETENIVKGFEVGAVDYLLKPINTAELTARVKTHVDLKQARQKLIDSHNQLMQQQEIIHQQKTQLIEHEKRQIEVALQKKNKELTSLLLQLTSYSEMFNRLLEDLQIVSKRTTAEMAQKLEGLFLSYKLQLGAKNWKEFETRFVQTHDKFTRELQAKHPNLTGNELRLCAYTSLNLSTKEIASITLQNEDSIKKARYRLRKKLGLDEKDNLLAYLNNFNL